MSTNVKCNKLLLGGICIIVLLVTIGCIVYAALREDNEVAENININEHTSLQDAVAPNEAVENKEQVINQDAPDIENNEQVQEALDEQTDLNEKTESSFVPYDIPLAPDIQKYTYELCMERDLDFEIVLALMYAESNYNEQLISKTNDWGLMQLNKGHHNWLITELGINNFLCGYQNANAGTFLLRNIANKYPDVHQMLMTYNFGEAGAKRNWDKGVYSSSYSRKIVARAEVIREMKPQ